MPYPFILMDIPWVSACSPTPLLDIFKNIGQLLAMPGSLKRQTDKDIALTARHPLFMFLMKAWRQTRRRGCLS